MLSRKPLPHRQEKDWFYFSSALALVLASDYIALRLLYCLEPLTTAHAVLGKAIDVAEKSLKLFVMVWTKSQRALSSSRSDYGHNIEKLRGEAATYSAVFDEAAIRQFARDLNDKSGKLYQHIRYGSEETTDGFEANLALLVPVIDRIFVQAVLALPKDEQRLLFFVSPLKHLITGSQFDQSRSRENALAALRYQNAELGALESLCAQLDAEHEELAKQIAEARNA